MGCCGAKGCGHPTGCFHPIHPMGWHPISGGHLWAASIRWAAIVAQWPAAAPLAAAIPCATKASSGLQPPPHGLPRPHKLWRANPRSEQSIGVAYTCPVTKINVHRSGRCLVVYAAPDPAQPNQRTVHRQRTANCHTHHKPICNHRCRVESMILQAHTHMPATMSSMASAARAL